jgi:hypothetical protein
VINRDELHFGRTTLSELCLLWTDRMPQVSIFLDCKFLPSVLVLSAVRI